DCSVRYTLDVRTCSRLLTNLDSCMLLRNGVKKIYAPGTPLAAMITDDPKGMLNPAHLGYRFLLRYLRTVAVGRGLSGTTDTTYVTPTPYTPEEAISWLALP